jgi:hypothetical protein
MHQMLFSQKSAYVVFKAVNVLRAYTCVHSFDDKSDRHRIRSREHEHTSTCSRVSDRVSERMHLLVDRSELICQQ